MDSDLPPFDMDTVVAEVKRRLATYDDPVEVFVLGSATQGIGEARDADFGITGADSFGIVFAKGQPLRLVSIADLVDELFSEIDDYVSNGHKVIVDGATASEAARWLAKIADDAG